MGALIVQKYGGTSVGSPERLQAVAKRIAEAHSAGHALIVVVSAMGQTTDELIDLANRVSKAPPHREMDMLLTAGERISMALLSMALSDLGVSALSFTGSQTGIITDGSHRSARIRRILGDRVRAALAENKVAIVAGFQGVSEQKEITTLGRGGSDTTAVALAAALNASCCEIYTDVDGVYSADPRIVPSARLWKKLPHDLLVELATRGTGVLHPRSIELSKQFHVPLKVRNSLNKNEGTEVIPRESSKESKEERIAENSESIRTAGKGMEEFRVVGVTADQSKALLRVNCLRPTVLSALWDLAANQHFSIIAPVFSGESVVFFADADSVDDWRKHLSRLIQDGFVRDFQFHLDLLPVSVVGDRFSQDGAALAQVVEVLSKQGITVNHGVASSLAITVAVPKTHANEAIKALHHFFIEGGENS